MKTAAFLLGAAALATMANAQTSKQIGTITKAKPVLEMVFVIDTTGSMGGLIDGAKQKVWSIVNDVMKAPTHPSVRVGLVAYRDHGDSYITQVLPVTNDLDKVYSTLMDYQAAGGGDEPEDVRQALSDGVRKAGWATRSPNVAQILFLVGDAPPHDDYGQEPDTLDTTAEAVKKGLIVNAIQCGASSSTQTVWTKIARRGEGEYFAIAQDGGVQSVATPYDKKLSELGTRIGSTYLAYGGGGMAGGAGRYRAEQAKNQAGLEAKVAASAPAGAQADRALNKALNSHAYAGDLLQSIENGAVKLDSIKKEDLPDDLQKMTPEARKAEIDKRMAARKNMRAEILTLSKQRDAYIDQARKKAGGKKNAFDTAVSAALKKQAAKKGLVW